MNQQGPATKNTHGCSPPGRAIRHTYVGGHAAWRWAESLVDAAPSWNRYEPSGATSTQPVKSKPDSAKLGLWVPSSTIKLNLFEQQGVAVDGACIHVHINCQPGTVLTQNWATATKIKVFAVLCRACLRVNGKMRALLCTGPGGHIRCPR